ncbi:MAG: hypothetical protein JKY65_22525, partial [Planctomycetes bacterium]|nr:hypothetical protein [Planctomycetota bacterium]
EGLGVLSPASWANRPLHVAGDNTQLQWAIGKERGALRLLWKTGRTRPAESADLTDYPQLVPWLFSAAFRGYASYTATITSRGMPGLATIRFQPPLAQRRWGHEAEFDINTTLGVVTEVRFTRGGKVFSKTVFSDFVQVAGKSWPTKETSYDVKGRAGWVRTRAFAALNAERAYAARLAILAPRRVGATVIGPLPGLDDARQAVEGGKPRLEDRLIAVSLEIGQQRWDAATPQVEALIKSLGKAEAAVLFRATWRSQRRRLEELRTFLYAEAAALAEAPARVEVARANALLSWSYSLGAAEQLVVLERLSAVFTRQTKRIDPAFALDQRRVNALAQAGQGEASFRLRETLTKAYPFSAQVHVGYAQALFNRQEAPKALAHLDRVLKTGGPWLPSEAGQLREELARELWQSVRYRELVKRIDAWDAAQVDPALPVHQYERLLAALIMLDREDDVAERIAAWFAALPKSALGGDRRTWHRLAGSINHLLGQMPGIPNYGGRIPPERQALLTKIASRLLSAEKAQGAESFQTPWDHGTRIFHDWRYRQADTSKLLGKELYAEFSAGIATLESARLRRLCQVLRGVGFAPADNREADKGKPAAGWPKLFGEVYTRWAGVADATSQEAQDLQSVIMSYAKRDLQLDCRRRLLKLAKTPAEKRARTRELYGALVGGSWTQAAEAEVLVLFQALEPSTKLKGEVLAEAQNAWIASLHDLHDWLASARGAALFQALPNRNKLDRRQAKAQRDALLRTARLALRARLVQTGQAWPELLRPWLEIESLWLSVKLKGEKGKLLETARTLLKKAVAGAGAAKSSPATDLRWRIVASRAVATQLLLLADLPRAGALAKKHGQAFEALINQAMGKKNELLDWREVLYCYLTVVGGQDTLRKRLVEWFGEGKEVKERRWGRALAAALTETDELAKAAAILKALENELTHEEWRRLADYYHVLDRRDESRWAKVESWGHLNEWRLQQGLQNDFYQKYQRRGKKVPEELNEEVPIRFLALLRKSSRPQNHVYVLRNYYATTRDFRLLACVPEAAIGQSAQGIYQLAAGFRQISTLLQEEATLDQLTKHLEVVRKRAKTVTDQRALDLIDFLTALQAARQKQGGEASGRRALAALTRAFERGQWAKGEDRLWAAFLAQQGSLRPAALADEQVRQLKVLVNRAKTKGSQEHVELSRYLAQIQWTYQKRRDALLTLEAALNASRQPDGSFPGYAWSLFETRISYLQAMKSWRQAETEIQAERKHPASYQTAHRLSQRLDQLYIACLRAGGEVSLGREATLFRAILERAYARLAVARNENEANQHVYQAVSVIQTRGHYREGRRVHNRAERAAAADLRDDVVELAHTRLPAVLSRWHHRGAPNMIQRVSQVVEQILGSRAALEFQVERAENEPRWLRLCNWDAWPSRGWQMSELRRKADTQGAQVYGSKLGKRLLKIVLNAMFRHLRHGQNTQQAIYHRHNHTFWAAARADFLRQAQAIIEKHGQEEPVLKRVCQYLWHGLSENKLATSLLAARNAAGKLGRGGREILVGYLFHAARYGEAIPVYRQLLKERPRYLSHRLNLARCLHHTGQAKAADAEIEAAIAMLKETKSWHEQAVASVAQACLDTGRHKQGSVLFKVAIKLHARVRSNRGVGDGTLAHYYGQLARCRSGLGDVIGAVDASAGAIVAWGGHRIQRQHSMNTLEQVLRKAKDLRGYLKHLDAEVKETGLENPLLRRVIGKVLMERQEPAEAVDQLLLALAARETDEVTHQLLIRCYDSLGDARAAANQYLALARVKGHEPSIYVELGNRLTKVGDTAGAERAYTTLVERQPNEAAAQGALAKVRERQRAYDEAAIHWRQWIRVRSDEPEGYIGLARSLILDGDRASAAKPLQALKTRKWHHRFEATVQSALRDLKRLRDYPEYRKRKLKRRKF